METITLGTVVVAIGENRDTDSVYLRATKGEGGNVLLESQATTDEEVDNLIAHVAVLVKQSRTPVVVAPAPAPVATVKPEGPEPLTRSEFNRRFADDRAGFYESTGTPCALYLGRGGTSLAPVEIIEDGAPTGKTTGLAWGKLSRDYRSHVYAWEWTADAMVANPEKFSRAALDELFHVSPKARERLKGPLATVGELKAAIDGLARLRRLGDTNAHLRAAEPEGFENKASEEDRAFFFTSAPASYDELGTVTMVPFEIGIVPYDGYDGYESNGSKLRVVSVAKGRASWQSNHYASGGYWSSETTADAVRARLAPEPSSESHREEQRFDDLESGRPAIHEEQRLDDLENGSRSTASSVELPKAKLRREIREARARVEAIAATAPSSRMSGLIDDLPSDAAIDNGYRTDDDLREMLADTIAQETTARGIAEKDSAYKEKKAAEKTYGLYHAPWMPEALRQAEVALGVKAALPMLGNGINGSVFRIDQNRVLKVTTAQAEIEFVRVIRALRARGQDLPGIVEYEADPVTLAAVAPRPSLPGHDRPTFAYIREECNPTTAKQDAHKGQSADLLMGIAQLAYKWTTYDGEKQEDIAREYAEKVAELGSDAAFAAVSSSLATLQSLGILTADAHIENTCRKGIPGFSVFDGDDSFLVFDAEIADPTSSVVRAILDTPTAPPVEPVSVFVALWPSPADAARLALPGGATVEDLHATLVFLGKHAPDDERLKRLSTTLQEFAAARPPVTALSTRYDVFENERATLYAALDAPSMGMLRGGIITVCKGAGLPPDTTHGFVPHITLSGKTPVRYPSGDAPKVAMRFAEIVFVVGHESIRYPLDESPRTYAVRYYVHGKIEQSHAMERATDARAALVSFLAKATEMRDMRVESVTFEYGSRSLLGDAEIAAVVSDRAIVDAELPSVARSALNVAMATSGRVTLGDAGTATLDGAPVLIEEDGAPQSGGHLWADAWQRYAGKVAQHAGLYERARTRPSGWTQTMMRLVAECFAPDAVEVLTSPYAELADLEQALGLIAKLEPLLELTNEPAPEAPAAPVSMPGVNFDLDTTPTPTVDPNAPRTRYGDLVVVMEGTSSGLDLRGDKPVRTEDGMVQTHRHYTGEWKDVGMGSTPVYAGGGMARLSRSKVPAFLRATTIVWKDSGDSYATQKALIDAHNERGDVVMQYGKLAKREDGVYLAISLRPGSTSRLSTWWFELFRGMIVRITNDQPTALAWLPQSDDYAGMKTWSAETVGGEDSITFRPAETPREVWTEGAILYLEGADQDRAKYQNDMGFNAGHSGPGMILANTIRYRGGLTDEQWIEAFGIARVYKKTQVGLPPDEVKAPKPPKAPRAKLVKVKPPRRLLDVLTSDPGEAWSDDNAMEQFLQRMPLINDHLNTTTPAIVEEKAKLQSDDKRWWQTMQLVEDADHLNAQSLDGEEEDEWEDMGRPTMVLRVHAENAIEYASRFWKAIQTDGSEYIDPDAAPDHA